jgi:3-hydroxyisobutyrate dehydrogenase-like beta-hydroxyacid dehydrogenase
LPADSPVIGLVGAGHMGSALGGSLRHGGARVITTLAGRSARTARLASAAGIETVDDLDALVRASSHILVVTPPGAAIDAAAGIAESIGRTGAAPLVVDMNAIAPPTVDRITAMLGGTDFVDGSISGPPPTVRAGARLYFAGARAAEVAGLPWRDVRPIVVSDRPGAASALKMSTASVYKGLVGLYAQAIRSADHYGVLDAVLADLAGAGYNLRRDVAVAATKAHRYVAEMEEISVAQGGAGLHPELFAAFARVYAEIATTPLADDDPESVGSGVSTDEIVARLRRTP